MTFMVNSSSHRPSTSYQIINLTASLQKVIARVKTAHANFDTSSAMTPVTDRQGRFSPLKAGTLALAFLPALVIAYWFLTHQLGPLPVKAALRLIGDWTIRFLVITLALTPLQRLINWPRITLIRRMLGVTAFAYALTHFMLYIVNSKYDLGFVASEIIHRIYLTIGFVALLGLSLLAGTSFDSSIRKLGKRWKQIHQLVYGIAVLGLLHYFIQSKIDVSPATLMAGLFILLMIYRVFINRRIALTPRVLGLSAVLASLLTALTEFAWYGLATGVDPFRIAKANLLISFGLRPAVIVLLVGLVPCAFVMFRNFSAAPQKQAA
jgi:methionine sulfoxide reductase heme-binding subunit